MGKFQAMQKCFLVFMALVSFHGSHLIHGRKIIKPLNTKDDPIAPHKTSHIIPDPIISASSKKVNTPTMTSNNGDSSLRFVDSSEDTSAFRPTTPGSSPGVGHKRISVGDMKEEKKIVVQSSPDVKVLVTTNGASKDDFEPTDPDHSPGVGHSYPNKNGVFGKWTLDRGTGDNGNKDIGDGTECPSFRNEH